MYWKFCAMEALGNVVAGSGSASPDNVGFVCAKTGDVHATQVTHTVKASRFIESFLVGWVRAGVDRNHSAGRV
jgi:hypothetical protein